MPNETKKYQIQQQQADGMLTLHPETDADVVLLDNTEAGMSATNVQDAFKEIMDTIDGLTGGGVVTGVKGDAESDYRKGQVNITKANIGLGNVDNTSDLNKPISTATKAALDLKADKSSLSGYIPTSQKGAASGVASLDATTKVPVAQIPDLSATYIPVTQKGTNNGVATLDGTGKVPAAQLPSYVDDVLEYSSKDNFPIEGEDGKIYIDTTTNLQYRWSGTQYVEISPSLALGETSSTAYAGDKGKANADNIAAILSGSKKVASATNADNATNAENATNADHATTADSATTATSATTAATAANANNVTGSINGHVITDIFETNGTTVKEATHAASANTATSATSATTATKLATARNIQLSGDVTGSASFDGSANAVIAATLASVGTAGTYSVVVTDAKGRVTSGGQIIEVGTTGQDAPSSALAVGGIFFKEI